MKVKVLEDSVKNATARLLESRSWCAATVATQARRRSVTMRSSALFTRRPHGNMLDCIQLCTTQRLHLHSVVRLFAYVARLSVGS